VATQKEKGRKIRILPTTKLLMLMLPMMQKWQQ